MKNNPFFLRGPFFLRIFIQKIFKIGVYKKNGHRKKNGWKCVFFISRFNWSSLFINFIRFPMPHRRNQLKKIHHPIHPKQHNYRKIVWIVLIVFRSIFHVVVVDGCENCDTKTDTIIKNVMKTGLFE